MNELFFRLPLQGYVAHLSIVVALRVHWTSFRMTRIALQKTVDLHFGEASQMYLFVYQWSFNQNFPIRIFLLTNPMLQMFDVN